MSAIFDKIPLSEQNEIRLIELSPGLSGQLIRCTLFKARLDDKPVYQALSYSWGESSITRDISLNGQHFGVTRNLWAALEGLRSECKRRVLWIDALCIDQMNANEKARQVSLMGQIFRECNEGLLWLGEEFEPDDTCCISGKKDCHAYAFEDTVMEGATSRQADRQLPNRGRRRNQCLANESHVAETVMGDQQSTRPGHPDCRWHGCHPRISTIESLITSLGRDDHLSDIPALYDTIRGPSVSTFQAIEPLLALGALMNRKWWSRSWTVQEAVLPPVSTLCCGSLQFLFERMSKAAENLYHHSRTCCSSVFTRLAQELDDLAYGEATINILFKFQKSFMTLATARSWMNAYETNLLDFLYIFHDREAKDCRDKVFALFGMLPTTFDFHADYSVPLVQLHEALSFHLLAIYPDNLLSILWRETPPTGTPSWIKDFRNETTALNRRFRFQGTRKDEIYHTLQSMARGELEGELNTSLAQELKTSVAGRKLFITQQGRIGLGPCWMQEGDEVWVLFGGAVPFVLRHIKDFEYQVIGDSYVHGIMFGEAVDVESKGEAVYLR